MGTSKENKRMNLVQWKRASKIDATYEMDVDLRTSNSFGGEGLLALKG